MNPGTSLSITKQDYLLISKRYVSVCHMACSRILSYIFSELILNIIRITHSKYVHPCSD